MDTSLAALATIASLNTRLFVNCLDGVTDDALRRQPSPETNNIGLLACHVVDARCYLLKLLDVEVPDPFGGRLERVQKVADMTWYPSVAELLAWWRDLGSALDARLGELTDADLVKPVKQSLPVDDPTLLGAIAFLVQHESYHIGQISLLRKYVGLPAMTYS